MNPTMITARVTDQHLQLVNEPLIASGGVDVVQIRFEFCGLWNGCGKTAVFYRDPETVYHVPIVDNLATVPWEVLTDKGFFYFGVFGAASNVRPTEAIRVKVVQGAITTATADPREPTPNIYQQLVAAYGLTEARVNNLIAPKDAVNGLDTYELSDDADSFPFRASFQSNGVAGCFYFEFCGIDLGNYQEAVSEQYRVPLKFAPMGTIYLDEQDLALAVNSTPVPEEGVCLVRFTTTHKNDTSIEAYSRFETFYPVLYPTLKEVQDARVGADGTVYGSAGDAVRNVTAATDTKLDATSLNAIANQTVTLAIADITDKVDNISETVTSNNILNPADLIAGYVTLDGRVSSSSSLRYTKPIPVKEGDIIRTYCCQGGGLVAEPRKCRFITAYKDGVANSYKGAEQTDEYVVPAGVDSVVITLYAENDMFTINYEPTHYEEHFEPYQKVKDGFIAPASETSFGLVKVWTTVVDGETVLNISTEV